MEVGDRIIVKEKRGTIRFNGIIENHPGDWIGVDYDDPEAGKHDGILDGKRYFTAKSPKSGAFVKKHLIDAGCDLVTAIENRYVDSVGYGLNSEDIILPGSKTIEFVGMAKTSEKQSNIFILTTIVLDDRNVSKPPPPGTLQFKRCRELNLYNNLLHKWEDVEEILKYFPNLEELVLRRNAMDTVTFSSFPPPWNCSPHLTTLVLSDCAVSSVTISYALACISSAVNLYALRNQIELFEVPVEMASRLKILDLEGNPLESFNNVVGSYPNLQRLSLVKCSLKDIDLSDENRFPILEHLNLMDNTITEWDSIRRLRHLSSLSTLFISTKNLKPENHTTSEEVIISLLPSLKDLNRFDINTVERRNAEIQFLNKYSSLPEEKRKFFQEDLDRIAQIWGPPVTDVISKGISMIKLTIGAVGSSKTIEKSLPLAIPVNRLAETLCRLFSMNNLKVKLFLERKDPSYRIELDNPARRLEQYSPDPADLLLLVPVEPERRH